MEYNLVDLKKFLNNINILYAHRKIVDGSEVRETLIQHSDLVMKYFNELDENKNTLIAVKNIIDNLVTDYTELNNNVCKEFILEMFVNGVYLHDVGKSNPAFQYNAMGNNYFAQTVKWHLSKNHSLLSALIYCDIFYKKAKELKLSRQVNPIINSFAYMISRHHSYLENVTIKQFSTLMLSIVEVEEQMLCNYIDQVDIKTLKQNTKNNVFKSEYLYILLKLFYSILTTCDFSATYEFMNGSKADICSDADLNRLVEKFENRELTKCIRSGNSVDGINKLRTDIFLECEKNLKVNQDKYIYYLEAPTGSGKTNTSINIAMNLVKDIGCNNVFYVFPFNTLAEQTSQVMDFWENNRDFIVINSTTPILQHKSDDENTEYERVYFNYQLANFPVVITSHIRLFNAIFGVTRDDTIWLYKLCNSVIILDEIQSYRNSLWSKFINILYKFARTLNFKIVIMSATLPKLDSLIKTDNESFVCDLIDSKKYFKSPLFKDRVKLNFDYLNTPMSVGQVAELVVDIFRKNRDKTILIEFIKKKSARICFNLLQEILAQEGDIAELTGDDNKAIRRSIIDKIKNRRINIVVATQVIEAGVDIDMDIGFKDISTLDSEEQFIGRINRSCKRDGLVYFFDCDDEKSVYKNDVRTELTIRNKEIREILQNKNFGKYYSEVFDKLKYIANSYDHNSNDYQFEKSVREIQFTEVNKALKLIDTVSYQIVLNYICYTDNIRYSGREVWNQYKSLLRNENNLSYGQLKIELSRIRAILDLFTFNMIGSYKNAEIHNFTENIGSLFYYDDGDRYITADGKFDREKFVEDSRGEFI